MSGKDFESGTGFGHETWLYGCSIPGVSTYQHVFRIKKTRKGNLFW